MAWNYRTSPVKHINGFKGIFIMVSNVKDICY